MEVKNAIEVKDENTKVLGGYLVKLFGDFFQGQIWFEERYKSNKLEILNLLDKITVMTCSGYSEDFRKQLILRLDLHKLAEYNPVYKKIVKSITEEKRYVLLDGVYFFKETLRDLVSLDLDATAYVIDEMIKNTKE